MKFFSKSIKWRWWSLDLNCFRLGHSHQKRETCQVDDAISPCKRKTPNRWMLMIATLRELRKGLNKLITWFTAQSKIFYSLRKKLKKIDAEVNQILSHYQGDLDKEKLISQLKALAVMFKDTGITVDSVI